MADNDFAAGLEQIADQLIALTKRLDAVEDHLQRQELRKSRTAPTSGADEAAVDALTRAGLNPILHHGRRY